MEYLVQLRFMQLLKYLDLCLPYYFILCNIPPVSFTLLSWFVSDCVDIFVIAFSP